MDDSKLTTGYNGGFANANIAAFERGMSGILTKITDTYNEFITSLYECWISPKAHEFSTYYGPKFLGIITKAKNDSNSIIERSVSAVKSAASSHGGSFSYTGGYVHSPSLTGVRLREMDGRFFGMYPAKVKVALDIFMTKMNAVKAELSSVPKSIAMYDTSNVIKTIYGNNIDAIKKGIESETSQIYKEVTQRIEEFKQAMEDANKNAISILDAAFSSVLSE